MLIDKYKDNLKSDILKVSHHGSITASSKEFIDIVDPDYSIIFAKKYNRYNFPHDIVLERLLNTSVVYQTGICGNINIQSNSNIFKIDGYRKI
jgi:competence protein ComEC